MCKIAVLLSSYNGGAYIEEQIKSIYEQTYQDFELYIRDDGSEKIFQEQLLALQKEYGFHLELGENLGFVRSFMDLLRQVRDADLYAFADQDDIWLEDKLQVAVKWFAMQKDTNQKPLLFHSAYNVIGNDKEEISKFYFPNTDYDFRRSITENHYSGFSMVVNQKMREMMLKGEPKSIGYHDWWAAMIAHAFGIGCSDAQVMALHRSHGDNVTTFNLGTRIEWLKKTLVEESELRRRAMEFDRCFHEELSDEKRKVLQMFCKEKYSLKNAIKKAFYPKRWRPILSSELVMRFLMLVGKI